MKKQNVMRKFASSPTPNVSDVSTESPCLTASIIVALTGPNIYAARSVVTLEKSSLRNETGDPGKSGKLSRLMA